MNYSDYINYFEQIAIDFPEFGHTANDRHFYRHDMDEIFTKINAAKGKLLALESFSGSLTGSADDVSNVIDGAFLVLKHAKPSNLDDREAALTETHALGNQIVAKMINDLYNEDPLIAGLGVSSFDWGKVGPIFDNYYGWRFQFQFIVPFKIC